MSSIFSKKTLYMIRVRVRISLFFCFLCSIYFLLCMLYLKPFRKKKYNMISLFFFSYSLFFSTFHVKFIIFSFFTYSLLSFSSLISYFFSYFLFSFSSLISYFLFVLCSLYSFSSLISYLFYVLFSPSHLSFLICSMFSFLLLISHFLFVLCSPVFFPSSSLFSFSHHLSPLSLPPPP